MDTLDDEKKSTVLNPELDECLKERANKQEREKLIDAYVSIWWLAIGVVILFVAVTVSVMLCVRLYL